MPSSVGTGIRRLSCVFLVISANENDAFGRSLL